MRVASLLLPLLMAPPDPLLDASRHVREEAITELALRGPPTPELLARLDDADLRRVVGVAAALERRGDKTALPALLRLADGVEGVGGRAGAEALVSIAFACDVQVDDLVPPEAVRAGRRIDGAIGRRVAALLESLGPGASADRPQQYRPLFAGGGRSAAALEAHLADPAGGPSRASALTILIRLTGLTPLPRCVALLEDAEAQVRASAAFAILGSGDRDALARIAALAEEASDLEPALQIAVFRAIRRTGMLGPRGAALLESAVRTRPADHALAAAQALRATDPARAERALGARAERHLLSEARSPGAGSEVALYHLLAGPLSPEILTRMRASATPMIAAAAEPETAGALARLGELLAPGSPIGGKELLRVRIVEAILRRPDAPWEARVAFAGSVLANEASSIRRMGLALLEPAPEEALAPLRPQLQATLDDPSEDVRVRAAALLARSPAALRVLVEALYDGDPALAGLVAGALRSARPDWPLPDPRAPLAIRRRAALALRERLESPARDME